MHPLLVVNNELTILWGSRLSKTIHEHILRDELRAGEADLDLGLEGGRDLLG